MSTLEMALAYAEYGWYVLPLHYPISRRCSCAKDDCASPAKHPIGALVPHGLGQATRDPDVIRRWWQRYPHANLGVRTGPESNLLVVDIDADKAGFDSWAKLEAQNPEYQLTKEAATGGGGSHLLFTWPDGITAELLRNSAGRLDAGIDVRAANGYIVAPDSTHISGRSYAWCDGPRKIQPPPAWLVNLLVKPPEPQSKSHRNRVSLPFTGRATGVPQSYVERAIQDELIQLEQQGGHGALTSSAFRLGQLHHLTGMNDDQIEQLIEHLADAALVRAGGAKSKPAALKTARDCYTAGKDYPREPKP